MSLLKPLFATFLSLFVLALLLPTVSYLDWATLLIAAIVLTLLNSFAKPILSIIFLPFTIITLGLFSLVINVLVLWLADYLVPGFSIAATTIAGIDLGQFGTLLVVSLLLSFVRSIIEMVL